MIDVPVKVKEVLREGSYKKNYRFVVQREESQRFITDIGKLSSSSLTYTVTTEGMYILHSAPALTEKTIELHIVSPGIGNQLVIYKTYTDKETYIPISYALPVGTTIDMSSSVQLTDIGITREDLVTTVSSWVDDFTIDNANLVSESVSIDERMCSGDTLKFGLCEGSSLEFQYFEKPNITGRQIKAFIDVEYGESEPYTIPMGYFTVKKCSRQASTGIIKVSACNKLQSDYLDAKANDLLLDLPSDIGIPNQMTIYNIQSSLLNNYAVEPEPISEELPAYRIVDKYIQGTFSFKVVGDSTTYSNPTIVSEYLQYTPTSHSEVKLIIAEYYRKLVEALSSFKAWVYSNIQSPDTFWSNFVNSQLYQKGFGLYGGIGTMSNNASFFIADGAISNYITTRHGDLNEVNYFNDLRTIEIYLPHVFQKKAGSGALWYIDHSLSEEDIKVYSMPYAPIDTTIVDITTLPDVTLRELQSASYETVCQFGQLSRETDLFSGVELNRSRLLPADTLYPSDSLYPDGSPISASKSMYSKLWADEGNVHKWRYLTITYKGLDANQQEQDFTLQRTVNEDGTDDYNMSDNWLFRNLVWTAADVAAYADAMVLKMKGITWFPFEMWCAGLPYLETGDEIEIPLDGQKYTSYVLQRQLKGIQNLQDTYINGSLDIF